MKARAWIAVVALVSAAGGVIGGFACSGPQDDGASCDKNGDCKSGTCNGGSCAGSSCSCATRVCATGTSCQGGWACVNDSTGTGAAVPLCRRLCPDGTGCANDEHCDDDKVCHGGALPPGVAFDTAPRPCSAFIDCPFKVKTFGGSGSIDHFDWAFDDDAGVTTTDPSTTHKYGPGSHTTGVTAFDKNGTQAKASTSDNICVDGVAIQCSPPEAECCQGSCNPEGGCN